MKQSKFTPGPWNCKKYPKVFGIMSETGRQIAIMTEHYGDCPEIPMTQFERSEQDKADAALITAAPEMYEVLERLSYELTKQNSEGKLNLKTPINQALRDSLDVLAKARGES